MSAGSNKLKYEYVKEYIEDKQCVLISKEYINAKEKLKIEFDCGHVSLISFECFKRGQRCSCDKEKRFKSTIEFKTREKILGSLRTSNFKFISFENNTASWDNKLTYECDKGHIETKGIREFMRFKHCVTCHNIFLSESQKGSMGNNWKGGKTRLTLFANKALVQWKKDSMKRLILIRLLL